MKQFYKTLSVAIILGGLSLSSQSFAQVNWKKPIHFLYKGTMTGYGKTLYITMGFYWDKNDGNVAGEYYYGSGKNGTINFDGFYNGQTKSLHLSEFIRLDSGEKGYTKNVFQGKNSGGWFKGKFEVPSDRKAYKIALKLVKVYKR